MDTRVPPSTTEPPRPSDPTTNLAPPDPGRPTSARVVIAVIVTILLLALSVAYHDGLFWTQPLSAIEEPGAYRVKGVLAHYDPVGESILLRDGDQQLTMHWNITQPAVGRVYVVDAELLPNGTIEALALTRVILFR